MSSKDLMVDGKLLSSLRVVDLKEALEKRGLSKSGTKKDLADRLKQYVLLENDRNTGPVDEEQIPNYSTREQLAEQNPFLRDYFQSQAELFHSQKVVKKLYEGMTHNPEVEPSKIVASEASEAAGANDHSDPPILAENLTNRHDSEDGKQKSTIEVEKHEEILGKEEIPLATAIHETENQNPKENKNANTVNSPAEIPKANTLEEQAVSVKPGFEDKVKDSISEDSENKGDEESDHRAPELEKADEQKTQVTVTPRDQDHGVSPQPKHSEDSPESHGSKSDSSYGGELSKHEGQIDFQEVAEEAVEEIDSVPVHVEKLHCSALSIEPVTLEDERTETSPLDAPKQDDSTAANAGSQVEDQLDYGDEEREDNDALFGDDVSTWRRQGKVDNFKSSITTVPTLLVISANEDDARVGKQPERGAKSFKIQTTFKENAEKVEQRDVNMDVDDVLDYGEDDGEVKRELAFTWSRRILRLKNRCPAAEKISDRKWIRTEKKPVVVTSEVLQAFFPDVKPLPDSEIKLEEKAVKEKEKIFADDPAPVTSMDAESNDVLPNFTRKIHIIPFDDPVKELTPPRNHVSDVLTIVNLTRPFTLMQLKELLQRTGAVEDIWVDKIKSRCLAKFATPAEAEETRAALHGIKWPSSNPKALFVDFSTQHELNQLKTNDVDGKARVEKPKEAKNTSVREWDVGKRSRSRSAGRLRRRSTSTERKRSRRSQSPSSKRSPHYDKKSKESDSKEELQAKALDELFRKTVTAPCLYWLPLTPQQISEKEELRRKRMIERERRIAEMEKLRR